MTVLTSMSSLLEQLRQPCTTPIPTRPVPVSELLNAGRVALLHSGGIETTYFRDTLLADHPELVDVIEPFRVPLLLDSYEYGILIPAAVLAVEHGFSTILISEDESYDTCTEPLMTVEGRHRLFELLGIHAYDNRDFGYRFDKWVAVQKEYGPGQPVSCWEQEAALERDNAHAEPCGNCKKCFVRFAVNAAKFRSTSYPITVDCLHRYMPSTLPAQWSYTDSVLRSCLEREEGLDNLLNTLTSLTLATRKRDDIARLQRIQLAVWEFYTELRDANLPPLHLSFKAQ